MLIFQWAVAGAGMGRSQGHNCVCLFVLDNVSYMGYITYNFKKEILKMAFEAMAEDVVEGCAAQAARFEAARETWDATEDGLDAGSEVGPDDGLGLGLPFEAHLNPMELRLVRKVVDGLEPEDPQEEMHACHMAVSHILAAQRFGKSRQEGLSQRAEQIEIGLAVRLMTLADRKSAALDRHRDLKHRRAREAKREAERTAEKAAQTAVREAALTGAPLGEAPPTGPAPEAPGPCPGQAPGQSPGQAPLSRQQRRALARREKKQARRAARVG